MGYGTPPQYAGGFPAYMVPQLSAGLGSPVDAMRGVSGSGAGGAAAMSQLRLSAAHYPYAQGWPQQGAVPMVMNPAQQHQQPYMLSPMMMGAGGSGVGAGAGQGTGQGAGAGTAVGSGPGVAGEPGGALEHTPELDAARHLTSLTAMGAHHLASKSPYAATTGDRWGRPVQQQQLHPQHPAHHLPHHAPDLATAFAAGAGVVGIGAGMGAGMGTSTAHASSSGNMGGDQGDGDREEED